MSTYKDTLKSIETIQKDIDESRKFLLTDGMPETAKKAVRESVVNWEKKIAKLRRELDKNLSGRRMELVEKMTDLFRPKINGIFLKLRADEKLLIDGKVISITFTAKEGSIETFSVRCSGTRTASGEPSKAAQQTAPSVGRYSVGDIEIDTYEEKRGDIVLLCSRPIGRTRVPLDIGVTDTDVADGEEIRYKKFTDLCETYDLTVAGGSAHRIFQQGALALMAKDSKRKISYRWIARR